MKYKNINEVENKYSRYRLCKILKKISHQDRNNLYPRIYFTKKGRFKEYFVREDSIGDIQIKQNTTKILNNFFITIRVCQSNYDESFYEKIIDSIHKMKPSKVIEYVIEGEKNKKHLHFNLKISKKELVRVLNRLRNNEYTILKYLNTKMTLLHKDFFRTNTCYTTPIYVEEVNDIINLRNYLQKQVEIKTIRSLNNKKNQH